MGTDCSTYLCSNQREHNVFGPTVLDIWLSAGRIHFETFGDLANIPTREIKLLKARCTVLPRNICGVILHTKDRFGETRKHSFTFGCRLQSPHSPTTANNENHRALTRINEVTNT